MSEEANTLTILFAFPSQLTQKVPQVRTQAWIPTPGQPHIIARALVSHQSATGSESTHQRFHLAEWS